MITVEEAVKIINDHLVNYGTEQVHFKNSIGRVLSEDLKADRDFPPFNRVMMDGIAISHRTELLNKQLNIEGLCAAGQAQGKLENQNHCLEVMTGAMLPLNTDTVIRYEDLKLDKGKAKILVDEIKGGQNIHRKGQDKKQGDLLINSNKVIRSAELGVIASIGKERLLVKRLPRILIVSTGDELVDIDKEPLSHQIRKSNVYQMMSIVNAMGLEAKLMHLNDDLEGVKNELQQAIKDYDVLLLSGGVSKGKLDFIPQAMEDLGIVKAFHRIKQRPGKPFWFGSKDQLKVFAFPGNPISTFLCMHKYFIPWYKKSMGIELREEFAILGTDVSFKPDLHYFLEVNLTSDATGKLNAYPQKGNGSGDLANLTCAEAFLELPLGKEVFAKGEVYPIIRFA